MNLRAEIKKLLTEIGPGKMTNTVYDTAWVARLIDLGEPMGERALQWLREKQLPDGSWGAEAPLYYHDRVICTLAAMNVLARYGDYEDQRRLERAEHIVQRMVKCLPSDAAGATVGFEMIVPTLIREANEVMDLHTQNGDRLLEKLIPHRSAKLSALPSKMINRKVTIAHSSEMAGNDGLHLLDMENLQESNGSVGHSPSATAYFIRYIRPGDPLALNYLEDVTEGGAVPNVVPFDVFEQAWTLWNFSLIESLDENLLELCDPHLDFLENAWQPGGGVGFAADYTPNDGDDTSLTYEVLKRYGRSVDIETVLKYEHVYYFRCFELESSPSISTNIHVLGALRQAGLSRTHPVVKKVLNFLRTVRTERAFWYDKWHVSPYYTTSHAVIAAAGYADELIEPAVDWLCETQNPDGSWGYYFPTAEETAYALQSLEIARRWGYPISGSVIDEARIWLLDHMEPPYPPLWIGKCLYCPELVVRSAILSALALVEN